MRIFLGTTGASAAPYAARLVQALFDADAEPGICISRAGYEVLATELAVIYQGASKSDVDATLYAEGPAPEGSALMHRKQGTV